MAKRKVFYETVLQILPLLLGVLTVIIQILDTNKTLLEHLTEFQISGTIAILAWICAIALVAQYKAHRSKIILATAVLYVVNGGLYWARFFALFFKT